MNSARPRLDGQTPPRPCTPWVNADSLAAIARTQFTLARDDEEVCMRSFRLVTLWVATAALLVACGGGDPYVPGSGAPAGAPTTKGAFTAVVSFGDSLSDVGSYAPATSLASNGTPPFLGGKFTTNETSN